MPLKAMPMYVIPQHVDEAPAFIFVLWGVGGVSTAVTFYYALRQLIQDRVATRKLMEAEGYVMAPWSVQYARIIVCTPMVMTSIAYAALFVPGMGNFIDLCLNICAATVLNALVHYYLEALGYPDHFSTIISKFEPRRWYCGTCCGGFFEPLCCLGWIFKKATRMDRRKIRVAYHMVFFWSFCCLFNAVWKFGTTQYFTPLEETDDGWCEAEDEINIATKVFKHISGFSSFIGLSGLCLISGLASLAVGEEWNDPRFLKFNSKRKADFVINYLFLLFWEWVMSKVPLEYREPVQQIPVMVNSMPFPSLNQTRMLNLTDADGDYMLATFKMLKCPVYDRAVCTFLLYCTSITMYMAFVSYNNWRLYPAADVTGRVMSMEVLKEASEDPEEGLDDEESEDSEDDNDDVGGQSAAAHPPTAEGTHTQDSCPCAEGGPAAVLSAAAREVSSAV